MATKKKSTTAKKNTAKSAKKSTVATKAKSTKTPVESRSELVNKSSVTSVNSADARSSQAVSSVKITKGSTLSRKDTALKKLNGWNWIFALLFAAQAVGLVYFADNAYRGLTSSYLTEDVIAGQNYAVYAQAVRHLMDLNIVYVLAALLGINAIMYALISSVMRKKYETDLSNQRNALRWMSAGMGSGIMVGTTALLVGVSDISLLFLIMASVGLAVVNSSVDSGEEVTGFMGYLKKSTLMQTVGTIAWLAPWIAIGLYLVGSEKYGSGVQPYLYGLVATAFIGTMLPMLYLNRKSQKRGNGEVDYTNVDWTYSALGFVVTAAFVWQIFFAIMA